MTTAATTKAKTKDTAAAPAEAPREFLVKPPQVVRLQVRIVGISPYISHAWDEKQKRAIREKHAGKLTKDRDPRDPQSEGERAAYRTADGKYGIPALAIKSAILQAAHKDLGIPRTLVSKAVFIHCDDPDKILPLRLEAEPQIQEDVVRLSNTSTDLRYRPYYYQWAVDLTFDMDVELLQVNDLLNLISRAGFGVGVGEWRPEKGGEYGRFEIDRTVEVKVREL